jgi:hypothetical protein
MFSLIQVIFLILKKKKGRKKEGDEVCTKIGQGVNKKEF